MALKVARPAALPVLRDSDDSDVDSPLDGIDSPTSSASTASVSPRPALHMKHKSKF